MVSYNCALDMTLPSWLSPPPSPHRARGPGNGSLRGALVVAHHFITLPDLKTHWTAAELQFLHPGTGAGRACCLLSHQCDAWFFLIGLALSSAQADGSLAC